VEFVRADPAATAAVLADVGAQVVVHLAMATSPDPAGGGRVAMKDQNVIGTMQLLAACRQAAALRKLVLRSSTAAYGASFRDPAVFTEETQPREVPRGGFARDILDVEGYVRDFRRRRPDVAATVLRLAPLIGAAVDSALTRYLAQPLVPTVLGRDPRLQFVHVDDALEIVYRSVVEDHPGTFNVAGAGVLALSQAIRRAGRVAVPVPEVGLSAVAALAGGGAAYGFDQLDLLVHGRVVDTTKLVKEFGYLPRTTAEAFDDFVAGHPAGTLPRRERVAAAERALRDGVRRFRAAVRG
ncbi:MAG TPA: NAD-dependent epimerase/dehydratase family protein, partial [Pilimelia sp.]|nr:NAD-dependent epimerase/dehydratase family protein [Pilimelia sp.]